MLFRRPNFWVLLWALGGVGLLLLQAIVRLAPRALEAVAMELSPVHWIVLFGWCAFSAYAEGHRGFHLRFAPRVVRRAVYLARQPFDWKTLLGPAFSMSFFHATRRSMLRAWIFVGAISLVVWVVRMFPQPWRGIVDAGVVLGLAWGLVSVAVHLRHTLRDGGTLPEDLPNLDATPTQSLRPTALGTPLAESPAHR